MWRRPSFARSFGLLRREGAERQIGNDALAARALVDNDLVRGAVDPLHGFKIHAFARHLGRLFVFVEDLVESGGLTRRLGDRLQAIAIGRLNDRGGLAARLRHHAVGVGLGLVAQTVLILLRGYHVLEGGDDLLRRVDGLQLDLQYQNAGPVRVQHLLHELLHVRLDPWAIDVQNLQDLAAADDFAHRAFGHRLHGLALIGDVESIVLRMRRIDLPDDDEFNVGDILIAGEHQAFFGQIDRCLVAWRTHVGPQGEADIDDVPIGDLQLLDFADRIGKIVIEARGGFAGVASEYLVQSDFIRFDGIKSG